MWLLLIPLLYLLIGKGIVLLHLLILAAYGGKLSAYEYFALWLLWPVAVPEYLKAMTR